MVGLPARGKTYIARKVARYLTWLGHHSRIFNVGNYRRDAVGAMQPSEFFDPDNEEFARQRAEVAINALNDMIGWLDKLDDDDEKSLSGSLNFQPPSASVREGPLKTPTSATPTQSTRVDEASKKPPGSASTASPGGRPSAAYSSTDHAGGAARVALYDATNSTPERRLFIMEQCREHGIDVMFIESVCDDPKIIVKLSSPDYKGADPEKAVEDFQSRIRFYEKTYQTLDRSEAEGTISFVKLINVGSQVIVNNVRGYIQSRIVYFLMNLNITPRSFYFSRHGESMFNVMQRIGGDASLSPRGEQFAKRLPEIVIRNLGEGTRLTVWTSTLRRTKETARHLHVPKVAWKQLDELDSGVCDGLTYEEIEARYPADFEERDSDKFNYRYHGGESYRDLVHRLEPVILELERHYEPNHSIMIIGHQAVLRAIYAYFLNIPHERLPYIKVPLHTVVKLTPKAYGCEEERFSADIAAVDTHRERGTPLNPSPRLNPSGLAHTHSLAPSSLDVVSPLGRISLNN
nr:Fructose-2,6-bisphosphatase [Polyrhizophydium stewartii]